ncbi:MAG: hypothetical protein IPK75_11310 [Acidobacteria bacterium]|nr:hypothetical protein [Acidobacteriota bacterium]
MCAAQNGQTASAFSFALQHLQGATSVRCARCP